MAVDMKRASIERKPDDKFIERTLTDTITKEGILGDPEADYSGAVKKTDPEEIRLVRKLDYRIMPTLWAMYFLNYVIAPERHSLSALKLMPAARSKCHCSGAPQRPRR